MSIPLVGQPITVLQQSITAVACCNCRHEMEERTFLILYTGVMVVCQQCRSGYMLQGILPNGDLNIVITKPRGEVQ